MNRRIGWLLVGALVGVLAAGPGMSRSEAGTGPALIRINDRELVVSVRDDGRGFAFSTPNCARIFSDTGFSRRM